MSVKINSLEIENVKRIKAVKLEPTANGLTVIGGRNNQGKTSVLDSIAWALGGENFRPSDATREGSIIDSDRVVVDKNWLEGKEIQEPANWNPAEQLITYLETLFEAGENVGYVTGSWEKTDEKGTRWLPQKGSWDRTAGQLIELLNDCKGDIGAVLGDYNPEAGAWIRFNPLDGNGCKNENVTEYRYALVESDRMELEQQNAILRELELPIACLVYSGKKSLHGSCIWFRCICP